MALATEEIHDPHHQGERQTNEDTRHDGEIKTAVASVEGDITRQTPEAERKLRAEKQQQPGSDEDNADDNNEFAEIAMGLHRAILTPVHAR
jgi:hypothetical protein